MIKLQGRDLLYLSHTDFFYRVSRLSLIKPNKTYFPIRKPYG